MIAGVLISLLFGILPLAVIAGVVGAAVAARAERDADVPREPGIGTVRRLFIYVLAFVGLVFATIGVALLISGALQVAFEQVIVSQRSQELSTALAFTLVGTPAWVIFAYLAQRSIAQHPVEARSQTRRLYFVVARGVALVIVVANAITVLRQLTGLDPLSSHGWGWLLAWAGVWVVHQRFIASEPAPSVMTRLLERLYGYFGAVIGLFVLLIGIAEAVRQPLTTLYDALTGAALVGQSLSPGVREAVVVILVGGAVWAWHWLRGLATRDRRSMLWHVQIFVFGTLPGVALVVVPVAILLYLVLQWYLGVPAIHRASAQFSDVPDLLGALVAGAATWGYHRALLRETTRGAERQTEPERVYRYLVALAGLITLAVGVATILALACDALGGSAGNLVRPAGWWQNRLLGAITALVVGGPLWAWYWNGLQRIAQRDEPARQSPMRRSFLFLAAGASLIAVIISLTVLVVQVLQPVLDGSASIGIVRDARWSIGVAATSAAIAVYYLLVLREDQGVTREAGIEAMRPRNVLVIAPADGGNLVVEAVRGIDGVRVRAWQRTDQSGAEITSGQLEALRDAVRASTAEQIAVVVSGGGFEVIPYRET